MYSKVFLVALLCFLVASPVMGGAMADLVGRRASSDLKCELCEFVVGYIESAVKNGTEEHRIAEEIGFMCNVLPWPLDTTCVWVVQQFVAVVINLLEDLMPPSRICYIVNMCQSLQEIFPQVNIYEMKCAKCMFHVMLARRQSQQLNIQENDDFPVARVCSTLKDAKSQRDCFTFLNQPELITDIINDTPVHTVCARANQCSLKDNVNDEMTANTFKSFIVQK